MNDKKTLNASYEVMAYNANPTIKTSKDKAPKVLSLRKSHLQF